MPTHYVSFAGHSLAIEHHGAITDLIKFLFRDTDSDPVTCPDVTLSIACDGENLTLHQGEQRLFRGKDESALATTLVRRTIFHLIDKNKDGMALHAAALSKNGQGLILPGRSGSGKTSTSTWLATKGFNYLTDEYVFIKENSNAIQAFTRPPNVKVKGLNALDTYFDMDKHKSQTIQSRHVAMIPPQLLNPDNRQEEATVCLILFPKYKQGSGFKLEELSKAQAGLALMESLVNARNLNGHGFGQATRLVRDTPSYRLTYGRLDEVRAELQEILPG